MPIIVRHLLQIKSSKSANIPWMEVTAEYLLPPIICLLNNKDSGRMESLVVLSLMTFLIIVLAAKGMILLPENKRVVVIRLGRFERVLEPGLNFVVPFIDVPHLVNLTINMPEWQSLSGSELNEKVKLLVLNDPNVNRDE